MQNVRPTDLVLQQIAQLGHYLGVGKNIVTLLGRGRHVFPDVSRQGNPDQLRHGLDKGGSVVVNSDYVKSPHVVSPKVAARHQAAHARHLGHFKQRQALVLDKLE